MKIQFFLPGMVGPLTYQNLRDQGVDMDDWDYMFVCELGESEYIPERAFGYDSFHRHEWYEVELSGKLYDVGIAYH